ncbi:hypothetical protein [Sorangium sp. So ce542]|uniref:hypothetical protein n=1 Tax=Sorangium sp. So ce542 TaxID=3133316 RepID=UPI003F5F21DC
MSIFRIMIVVFCVALAIFLLWLIGPPSTISPGGIPHVTTATLAITAGPAAPVAPEQERMRMEVMPKNGMRVEALSANPELIERLRTRALNNLDLKEVRPFRVQDQDEELRKLADELMTYIAFFALDKGQTISVLAGHKLYTWPGSLGACADRTTPMGDWYNEVPTADCLQLVSSSMLARVNALNKVVAISMRDTKNVVAIHDRVAVETTYREKSTVPMTIESFRGCVGTSSPISRTDKCGWSAGYVGRCMVERDGDLSGKEVKLRLGSAVDGASPAFVRVCQGIHGCNHEQDGAAPKKYMRLVDSFSVDTGGRFQFKCPLNGPSYDVQTEDGGFRRVQYGYFSVMLSRKDLVVEVAPESAERVEYPAREADVFTYREGAFYGNIFESTARDASDKALFGKQYACYGEDWTEKMANIADRLCAHPQPVNGTCFVNVPESCSPYPPERLPGVCERSGDAKDFVYTRCGKSSPLWELPITVYLNHPCDLRSHAACSSLEPWPLPLRAFMPITPAPGAPGP